MAPATVSPSGRVLGLFVSELTAEWGDGVVVAAGEFSGDETAIAGCFPFPGWYGDLLHQAPHVAFLREGCPPSEPVLLLVSTAGGEMLLRGSFVYYLTSQWMPLRGKSLRPAKCECPSQLIHWRTTCEQRAPEL